MKNLINHPLIQPFWHQKSHLFNDSDHTDTYEWQYLLEIRADTTFDLTVIKSHVYTSMKWSENSYSGNWEIMELQEDLLRLGLHFLTEEGQPVNFIFQYDGNYVQLKAATKMDQEQLSLLLDAENCFPRNTEEPNKMTISTKITFVAISILLLAVGFWAYNGYLDRSFQRIKKDDSGIPVKVAFLDTCSSIRNAGFSYNLTKLTLTNEFDSRRWYLFPMFLGDTLPSDGIFYIGRYTPYIEGRKYPVEKSNLRIVEARFDVREDGIFTIFYLPPQSTIILDNYPFFIKDEALGHEFEVWEVEHLSTDGKIPFDVWLSCDLLSSGNVRLTQKVRGMPYCLLESDYWVISSQNTQYSPILPKVKATHIQAMGIRKLSLKMEGI